MFVEEEYREDALATVVSGLVLGCLLALPDHHPVVAVQSGNVWTLPARQEERAKPCWHPVDMGLAVTRRVATRLLNRTVPAVVRHCRRQCLFGILGSRPVFWGCRQSWTGAESPSFQASEENKVSESLDSHVIVVHDSCTREKACVPATVPTRKDGRWGVRAGRRILGWLYTGPCGCQQHNPLKVVST